MESLKSITTKCLVEELKTREGVNPYTVAPYEDLTVKTNGPSVVLVVID